jgi:hypothetical protein
MICPKCHVLAKVRNVKDRDTPVTVRRYECRSCKVVMISEEKVLFVGKLTPRK